MYSSSVTWLPQVALVPSPSTSSMARWEGGGKSAYSRISRITIALSPPIMGGRASKGRFQAENSSYATDREKAWLI